MIQESSFKDDKPLYCEDGVIKICEMLRKKKPELSYINQQKQFYKTLESISQSAAIKKHCENISQFFNIYYLISKILDEMLKTSDNLQFNVGDKKIIKVVLKSILIMEAEQFKLNSTWRPIQMNQCIETINKLIEKLVNDLKNQKIYSEDLTNLYSADKLRESPQFLQAYKKNGTKFNEKQYECCDREAIKTLRSYFQEHFYQVLGSYPSKYQTPNEKLKLMILMMRFKTKIVSNENLDQKSMIHELNKWKGYEKLQKFFRQVTIQEIKEQKKYQKKCRLN